MAVLCMGPQFGLTGSKSIHSINILIFLFTQDLFYPSSVGGATLGCGQFVLVGRLKFLRVLQNNGSILAWNIDDTVGSGQNDVARTDAGTAAGNEHIDPTGHLLGLLQISHHDFAQERTGVVLLIRYNQHIALLGLGTGYIEAAEGRFCCIFDVGTVKARCPWRQADFGDLAALFPTHPTQHWQSFLLKSTDQGWFIHDRAPGGVNKGGGLLDNKHMGRFAVESLC